MNPNTELAIADTDTLAALSSAEIDMQVATAHKFPRQVTIFRDEVATLATLNETVAGECSYVLPRDGKNIEGPSARFAEIIVSAWGNCRCGARVVFEDAQFVVAQGFFHDLQKNSAITFEVRRRIVNKYGQRFNADMIAVTGNAACSIALRNAVLKGVPKALWADLWDQARKVAMGNGSQSLASRRAEALKLFQSSYGVPPEEVYRFLQISGPSDIDMSHLMTLRGLVTAFKDGDTSPEEVFAQPVQNNKRAAPVNIAAALDNFAAAVTNESASSSIDLDRQNQSPSAEPDRAFQVPAPTSPAPRVLASHGAGDVPSSNPLDIAYQRGRRTAEANAPRKLPRDSGYHYRGRAAEADAFYEGYDDQAKAMTDVERVATS